MNDYRVRIINHNTGEIIEHEFPTLDLAQAFELGVTAALGIVWDFDCEYFIERRTETWERVPEEPDIIEPEDAWTDEDEEYFQKYFVNSGNTSEDW